MILPNDECCYNCVYFDEGVCQHKEAYVKKEDWCDWFLPFTKPEDDESEVDDGNDNRP